MFPVASYAGATATDGQQTVTLPDEPAKAALLSGATHLTLSKGERTIEIEASVPMSLIDHRQWGTQDYLLAGYPVGGKVAAGTAWAAQVSVKVSADG
jgi:hypothetical protein